jgi:class 3 adenylate cyclase
MRYHFGGVELDTDTYELRSGGRLVDVEPQAFEILVHLLARRARVVTTEELLHTAEVERRGDAIAGIGVHVASRLADAAEPGSIWVSRTVTDLVAGCGLASASRGEHQLKGLPQPWAFYEVAV